MRKKYQAPLLYLILVLGSTIFAEIIGQKHEYVISLVALYIAVLSFHKKQKLKLKMKIDGSDLFKGLPITANAVTDDEPGSE